MKIDIEEDFDKLPSEIQIAIRDKWDEMDKELYEWCKTHQCDNYYEGDCFEWDKFIKACKIIESYNLQKYPK